MSPSRHEASPRHESPAPGRPRTYRYFAPPPGSQVSRPELEAVVDGAWHRGPVIVAGPRGSGKTSIASLLAHRHGRCAWLSLEETDRQPYQLVCSLWRSLRDCFRTVAQHLTPQPSERDPQLALIELVDALEQLRRPGRIVIDDLQVLANSEGERLLTRFLACVATWVRPLLLTWDPPSTALVECAAQPGVTFVGPHHLVLGPDQSRALVRHIGGDAIPDADVDHIVRRAAGWLAGVELLTLAHHHDARAVASADAVETPEWIVECIVGELPTDLLAVAMELAVLPAFGSAVIERLVPGQDAAAVLARLVASPLLMERTGDSVFSHRFHGLCREALLRVFHDLHPANRREELFDRLVHILAERGANEEAYDLAVERQRWATAGQLVAERHFKLLFNGQERAVLTDAARWPSAQLVACPTVGIVTCFALLCARFDRRFAHTWSQLQHHTFDDVAVEQIRHLVAATWARLLPVGREAADPDRSVAAIREHLEQARPQSDPGQTLYGAGLWFMEATRLALREDDCARALTVVAEFRHLVGESAELMTRMWAEWWAAGVHFYCGDASRLLAIAAQVAQIQSTGIKLPDNVGVTFVTFAQAALARGDLATAQQWVERAFEVGDPPDDLENARSLASIAMRVSACSDDGIDSWTTVYHHVRELLAAHELPTEAACLDAVRTNIALSRLPIDARAAIASAWLDTPGVREATHPIDWHQPDGGERFDFAEHLRLRAAAYANRHVEPPEHVINRLQVRAQRAGRRACVVACHLLRAELIALGQLPGSIERAIEAAVSVAGPLGLAGPFLECDDKLRAVVATVAPRLGYPQLCVGAATPSGPPTEKVSLTAAERQVLRAAAGGLTNREIARELFVAPATIKKHLENIYGKLGVGRRIQAVQRAIEWGQLVDDEAEAGAPASAISRRKQDNK